MKSSTQVFASLVAALATLSQSAIATPSSRVISQNAIDSYQLTGKKITLPSKIESQPPSLVAQQSDICKAGTIPVRINAPDNATPAYSGTLQPGVNSGTRCVFFKDVSLSIRANSKSKTWLIIHGWLNNSESTEIKALALEVARQNPGDRVLMLDWGEAARNGGNTQVPKVGDVGSLGVYYAASWIRPIAEAVVDKLKSDYGLTEQEASQNLNIVGHSLGTLMAGEIGAVYSGMSPKGEKEKGGSPINTIIALDPASETSTALNLGGYDVDGRTPAYTFKGKNFLGASQRDPHPEAIDRPKRFSQVSRFSRAFVGAKSLAGNQEFASWAHESFQMDFGNKFDTGDEHGRVVQAFTNLISQHPFKQADSKNNFLDLNDMRVHNDCEDKGSSYFMKCNTVDGKHEGTVEVNSSNLPILVKFTTSFGKKQQIAATQSKPIATNPSNRPTQSVGKAYCTNIRNNRDLGTYIITQAILESNETEYMFRYVLKRDGIRSTYILNSKLIITKAYYFNPKKNEKIDSADIVGKKLNVKSDGSFELTESSSDRFICAIEGVLTFVGGSRRKLFQ